MQSELGSYQIITVIRRVTPTFYVRVPRKRQFAFDRVKANRMNYFRTRTRTFGRCVLGTSCRAKGCAAGQSELQFSISRSTTTTTTPSGQISGLYDMYPRSPFPGPATMTRPEVGC